MNDYNLTTIRLIVMQREGCGSHAIALMLWAMHHSDYYVYRKKTAMQETGLSKHEFAMAAEDLKKFNCYKVNVYKNDLGNLVSQMSFSWGNLSKINAPDESIEVIDLDDA